MHWRWLDGRRENRRRRPVTCRNQKTAKSVALYNVFASGGTETSGLAPGEKNNTWKVELYNGAPKLPWLDGFCFQVVFSGLASTPGYYPCPSFTILHVVVMKGDMLKD